MSRDELWDGLKREHNKRVGKNHERLEFAIKLLEKNEINYRIKNEQIGHIHAWRKCDDKLFQFWSGTGKILGKEVRGIHNFIKLLNK